MFFETIACHMTNPATVYFMLLCGYYYLYVDIMWILLYYCVYINCVDKVINCIIISSANRPNKLLTIKAF